MATEPFRHATYNNDVTHMLGDVVGPGLNGKLWVATDVEYDPETNKTRVEFDEYRPTMMEA